VTATRERMPEAGSKRQSGDTSGGPKARSCACARRSGWDLSAEGVSSPEIIWRWCVRCGADSGSFRWARCCSG